MQAAMIGEVETLGPGELKSPGTHSIRPTDEKVDRKTSHFIRSLNYVEL
jgi:hypothetical protein